jgi:FkbM family methyltransferase
LAYKSQNNEVAYVLQYFNGFVGTLLSIGECDGITFSNSYDLIALGWKATLVEPSKHNFNNIPERDGVEKFNFGIGQTGLVPFHITPDGLLCSTSTENANRWQLPYRTAQVQFYSYADALKRFTNKQFDFITIDAEGMDWEILQQIDLTNVQCLCIEYGKYEREIRVYCSGFRVIHRNGENLILAK